MSSQGLGSEPGEVTVSETLVEWVADAAVPVIVTGYVPGAVPEPTVNVRVEELPAVTDAGLKPAVTPLGRPEAASEMDSALRMQQLKMQLRSTINAILDVRVHTRGMTQDEAMRLMTVRGHQEEGEAAGTWRRALLTSTQLSTYYVGYHEVRDVVHRLGFARPAATTRQLHDEVLAHGSPPPRHLRTLLGL